MIGLMGKGLRLVARAIKRRDASGHRENRERTSRHDPAVRLDPYMREGQRQWLHEKNKRGDFVFPPQD